MVDPIPLDRDDGAAITLVDAHASELTADDRDGLYCLPEPPALATLPAWWGRSLPVAITPDQLDQWVVASLGGLAEWATLREQEPRQFIVLRCLSVTFSAFVYVAIDVSLDRIVALKVSRRPDDDHEARMLQALAHPHVIEVHALERVDGYVCAVLEWAECHLADFAPGQLWEVVLARLLEAGRALVHVHASGYVHGDVKPTNILVCDGEAKLADFGLAGLPTADGPGGGTVIYMPPERMAGVWGFEGDVFSWAQTALDLLDTCRPTAPESVLQILGRGIDPTPQCRPSMADMLEQIERELDELFERELATLARPRRVASLLAWASTLALAALGGYGCAAWG